MKSTMTRLVLVMALASVVFDLVLAGDLEPPGPPASTMVTLQRIYDAYSGEVAKTGQSLCYDAAGAEMLCAGTGQDGEYQAGFSVDPRFTNNEDGTVTDKLTGLIWLLNANCFGPRTWTDALSEANSLEHGACGLTDLSSAGDWRLPNLRELQSLIDYQNSNPALSTGHPFSGVQSGYYSSSTTQASNPSSAWGVFLGYGNVHPGYKMNTDYFWPVRGGQ